MNMFFNNPYIYEVYKRQHEELIKEAAMQRMVKEAKRVENTDHASLNLFALVGRELSRIGFSLEVRYGSQPEASTWFAQQVNTGDCR